LSQAGIVGGAGQAKVGDLDPIVNASFQQDIARFDVAMNQVLRMGRSETFRDLLPSSTRARRASLTRSNLTKSSWKSTIIASIQLHK